MPTLLPRQGLNCRLGRAIAKPNKTLLMLGFVPQPNLQSYRQF